MLWPWWDLSTICCCQTEEDCAGRVSAQCLLLAVQGGLHSTVSHLFSLWRRHHLPDRYVLLPGGHHHHGHQDIQVGPNSSVREYFQLRLTCRVAILDASYIVGYSFGNFLSAPVYESLDFYGTFGISLAIYCLNFSFIFFFLNESRYEDPAIQISVVKSCFVISKYCPRNPTLKQ